MLGRLPIVQGRRFGCTQCGNCCYQPGYVFFGLDEMKKMARYLAMSLATFKEEFSVEWDASAEAWVLEAKGERGCPVLDEEGRCRVHPAKPIQCKTFPFWDEMLEAEAWEEAKSYCEGLDAQDGRLYSAREIRAIRDGRIGTDDDEAGSV